MYFYFFKTLTVLRSLSSHRLQQLLLYLVEKQIAVGESFAQTTSSQTDRFWLRRGQIQEQTQKVGFDQLPKQNWEADRRDRSHPELYGRKHEHLYWKNPSI